MSKPISELDAHKHLRVIRFLVFSHFVISLSFTQKNITGFFNLVV